MAKQKATMVKTRYRTMTVDGTTYCAVCGAKNHKCCPTPDTSFDAFKRAAQQFGLLVNDSVLLGFYQDYLLGQPMSPAAYFDAIRAPLNAPVARNRTGEPR